MATPGSYDLERFVTAQAGTFETALAEVRAGEKRSHWMWFIFPQLKGLGRSPTALSYGLASLDEARAYLAHPVLGPRLSLVTEAVLDAKDRSLNAIFGSPDDLKFCSSMTLFARVAGDPGAPFRRALDRFCNGREDERTVGLLAGEAARRTAP